MIVVMVLVLLLGGCELRFQDPFSHPADDADTRIFDDESGSGTASGDGSDGGADGDSGGDADEGPPYGGVIDFRTITVDGIGDDWDGVTSIIYDAAGDSLYAGTGGDIVRVRLAADDTFLYFAIDLADDTPSTTQEFDYKVWIQDPGADIDNFIVGNIEFRVSYDGANWFADAGVWDGNDWAIIPGLDSAWGAAGSPNGPVEMQIDRSMVIQKNDLIFKGHIQRTTVPEDPDTTEKWLYTLP
jgi:hypothetical protein